MKHLNFINSYKKLELIPHVSFFIINISTYFSIKNVFVSPSIILIIIPNLDFFSNISCLEIN